MLPAGEINDLKENRWKKVKIKSDKKIVLSENARMVLEKRYLVKDENGTPAETPEEMFRRISKFVASADFLYGKTESEVNAVADIFFNMMAEMEFIPNSPTLMNAGRPLGQLSACFVLPVEDSMAGIFDSIKHMALIHQSGGGTGFSFSRLRPKNDLVRSTYGISSGPVSFMKIFNTATETIKQGGTRRGANMAILNIDHPDIIEFVELKGDEGEMANFNCSVAVTDSFMEAVKENREYSLVNPRTGTAVNKLNAGDVYRRIVETAWRSGEPGVIFIDRMNEKNPLKKLGRIESTNPCGEQPLLPYESCNLGSINLTRVLKDENGNCSIDYKTIARITRNAVHFLDNVVDLNRYPLPEIEKATLANRKIGLGVMGFADMLIRLGIPYDSQEAVETAEKVMSYIQDESKAASRGLAAERGVFPNFEKSDYAERGEVPIRNATTTTIAPTGTISIIANTSSGIEPLYAVAFMRNVMDQNTLVELNPLFEEKARSLGFYSEKLMKNIAKAGSLHGLSDVPEEIKRLFVTAHDVKPFWHIKIQAAFQKYVDNAVSKTVNFPFDAEYKDIEEAYNLAYELGCKGITVYRDRSRENQVLEVNRPEKELETLPHGRYLTPKPRDEVIHGATRKMTTGCGSLYVTINEDERGLFEVFATMGKGGGCAASQAEAVSRLISLSLRCGIDAHQIIKQLKGVRCPNQAWEKGGRIYSCSDAIAKAIERHLYGNMKKADEIPLESNLAETNGRGEAEIMVGVCPECHGPLEFESGCSICRVCGFSRCG